MQQHLTALEQTGLMRDLNQAVQLGLNSTHYATMVAVGFHGRRGLLVLTNAGHPPPFWYRAKRDEWAWLERLQPEPSAGAVGTPLGLLSDISYDRKIVKPLAGDLVVLYTDGGPSPRAWMRSAGRTLVAAYRSRRRCRWPGSLYPASE